MNTRISSVRDSLGRLHDVSYRDGASINTANLAGDGSRLTGLPTLHLLDGRELRQFDGRLRTDDGEWFDAA